MTRNPKVRRAVRLALLMGGTAALLANPAAFAQEQDQDAAEKPMEEVVVTGSRIISTNLDSPSPVQTISSEDIAKTGTVNLQDILLKNPYVRHTDAEPHEFELSDLGRGRLDRRPSQPRCRSHPDAG
jgi:outer membrane receptor for ferrienterochelin and colicin